MSRLITIFLSLLTMSLFVYIDKQKDETDALKKDITMIAEMYNTLNHSTMEYAEKYRFVRGAGATKEQAQELLLHANNYGLDALILASLIRSESRFKENVIHSDKACKGIGGINTKFWGNAIGIEAVAKVLSTLLEKSKGDYREALHMYKSRTPKGLKLADDVLVYVAKNK